jgi:hypothetical protein
MTSIKINQKINNWIINSDEIKENGRIYNTPARKPSLFRGWDEWR